MSTKLERITPILDTIEKAGGLNMAESLVKYSPAFMELSSKERRQATFSIWAFLFLGRENRKHMFLHEAPECQGSDTTKF